jgi:peptidoglycan LD-endopeptidase LytH
MASPAAIPSHRRSASMASRARTVAVVALLFAMAVVGGVKLSSESPSGPSSPAAAGVSAPAPAGRASPAPMSTAPRYVFPVQAAVATYAHAHDDYPASDILAPCGTPVVAAADGVVLELNRVDRWDPATDDGAWRGGRFMSILGDDGVRYYGAHFSVIVDALAPGVRVSAGQQIGLVGTTGLSGACHLHFGISPPCARVGDWWNRRGVIWPWPYLDAWRAGTSTSAVPEVSAWHTSHGCPAAP